MAGFVEAYGLKIGGKSKMKRLALVLMLLTLPFTAQATTHYERTVTLICKPSDVIWETFILDGAWMRNFTIHKGWTVKRIAQVDYSIYVRLEKLDGETREFEFNNGWPCKIETRRKPIQPESDNFNQID